MEQELRRIANEIHKLTRVIERMEKEIGKFNEALNTPTFTVTTEDS